MNKSNEQAEAEVVLSSSLVEVEVEVGVILLFRVAGWLGWSGWISRR